MTAPWIQTASGIAFDLVNPTPDMVKAGDIAHALGGICRYNGMTTDHYSVAEHSILIARWLRDNNAGSPLCYTLALAGLLHDAHEAYIGDLTAPLLATMPAEVRIQWWQPLRNRIDDVIAAALLPPAIGHRPLWDQPEVRKAGVRILLDERGSLLGSPPQPWDIDDGRWERLGVPVLLLSRDEARVWWLQEYRNLYPLAEAEFVAIRMGAAT